MFIEKRKPPLLSSVGAAYRSYRHTALTGLGAKEKGCYKYNVLTGLKRMRSEDTHSCLKSRNDSESVLPNLQIKKTVFSLKLTPTGSGG